MKDLATQLKELNKIQPSTQWKDSSKQAILAKISESSPKKMSLLAEFLYFAKLSGNLFQSFVMKPVGTMALVAVLVLGGGVLKVTADNSLPGDLLYSLKTGGEKMQVALIFNEEKRVQARLKIINERINEINTIIANKEKDQEAKTIMALNNFHRDFLPVQEDLVSVSGSTEAIRIARSVEDKTNEFGFILNKTQDKTGDLAQSDIKKAIDDVNRANFRALEVLVVGGDDDSQIAKKIDTKIFEAEGSTTNGEALAKLDEARLELENLNFVVALQKIKESSQLVEDENNATSSEDVIDEAGVVKGESTSTVWTIEESNKFLNESTTPEVIK